MRLVKFTTGLVALGVAVALAGFVCSGPGCHAGHGPKTTSPAYRAYRY